MLKFSNDPYHIRRLSAQERQWAYCGLDSCLTSEIGRALLPQLNRNQQGIYDFERAQRAPALMMQMRGFRVDDMERRKLFNERKADGRRWQKELDQLAKEVREKDKPALLGELSEREAALERAEGREAKTAARRALKETHKKLAKTEGFSYIKGLAPSPQQLAEFFYEDMGVAAQRNKKGKVSTDVECLERLIKNFPKTKPIASLVLKLRHWQKQIEVLHERNLSPDGRFRASFSVGQTDTGRWSSTDDCYRKGDNLQNKDKRVRRIFIADVGKRFLSADLAQAESRCIAYLAGDEAYIQAHEEGNVHVRAGWTFWPDDLPWTKDLKKDKELMRLTPVPWISQPTPKDGEEPAVSYYHMSKVGQHSITRGSTEYGLSFNLGVTRARALELLQRFRAEYPMVEELQNRRREMLKTTGVIVSPLGRERQFFGRPWDKHTLRVALSDTPQGMTVDVCDIALLRIYHSMVPEKIWLLQQGHDSLVMEADDNEETLPAVREEILKHFNVPVRVLGLDGELRTMTIPVELEEGYNWRDLK